MIGNGRRKGFLLLLGLALSLPLLSPRALAVPSFARQTHMPCTECHTVFPELTPFGRIFKLGGYVLSKTGKRYELPPPLAGMAQISFTGSRGLTSGVAPFDSTHRATDKINLPQQLSLFFGGRIYDKIGAFVQGTYDGVSNKVFLDILDIRYSNNTIMWGKNLIYGLTLNNSPTAQDVWNSTPAWRFPFASSGVASTPAAATIIDGTLDQQIGGLGAYVFWNNLIYLEGTVYRTAGNGLTKPLGAGTTTEQVLDDAAPYWRLALEHRWKDHFLTIGTFGMRADIFPSGVRSGPADRFTDVAFDAQYQYMGTLGAEHKQGQMQMAGGPMPEDQMIGGQMAGGPMGKAGKHIITAHATWIHEDQDWRAGFPLGNMANPSDFLNTFRVNLNYYYRIPMGDIGGSIGYFSTTGRTDQALYPSIRTDGSRTGSPNSNGFVLELGYRPWTKTKISLQYVIYDKFNGAHSNYDGFGSHASDRNTLYAVLWFLF